MGRCRRRCNSPFTSWSLACHLERIVCRSTVKRPLRVFAQLCVKPRKLKVSGFPSPRPRRFWSANRPNSMRRVLYKENTDEVHDQLVRTSARIAYGVRECPEADTGGFHSMEGARQFRSEEHTSE